MERVIIGVDPRKRSVSIEPREHSLSPQIASRRPHAESDPRTAPAGQPGWTSPCIAANKPPGYAEIARTRTRLNINYVPCWNVRPAHAYTLPLCTPRQTM
jgi:hypothetical protein